MKVQTLRNINPSDLSRIKLRSFGKAYSISPEIKKILNDIKKRGDTAIFEKYRKRVGANYTIKVSPEEIKQAYKNVDNAFIKVAKQAIKNITKVHLVQLQKKETVVNPEVGISVWREWRPIEKVGLYIPGGKAIYPSSVLMTGIPARIAGCQTIIMCTPPDSKGNVPSPTLVAADLIGIKNIFKVGGSEAIGAMAFGTRTIPSVYKIFGAGNSFVTEAKMQVYGTVDIDMPAGPSEVFIIADESANPAFIAADLLADGEHGEDSGCVLVTTSLKVAEGVVKEIDKQLKDLSTAERTKKALESYGLIAVVDTLLEAIEFSNDYAPEHLEIMTKNPKDILKKITNAGSVFLGPWTTKGSGDYATGANHVLPTGTMAKMFNPLSVESFGKKMQVQIVESKNALSKIRTIIETFGEIEGLPAHKNSATIRFLK